MGRAFTLIELLVVITIVIVLLALLVPALDRAVYQAELLRCGENQKSTISGLQQYAFDNRRYYPQRPLPDRTTATPIAPHQLTNPTEGAHGPGSYDVRPLLRGYVLVNKMLNDPMVQPVDLEKTSASGGASDTYYYASQYLWFGWRYVLDSGTTRLPGMDKFGDTWTGLVYPLAPRRTRTFSVLVSDIDAWTNVAWSSHPDGNRLYNQVLQEAPFVGFITQSLWRTDASQGTWRDALDLNYGYDDGSVARVSRIVFEMSAGERMERVNNNFEGSGGWANVPRQ
jgi:type II secretory pathway pseudopilin PulG